MNFLWAEHQEGVGWVVLLVDAINVFNEINRTAMLRHVRHTRPDGDQFSFNIYRNCKVLVLWGGELTCHSK